MFKQESVAALSKEKWMSENKYLTLNITTKIIESFVTWIYHLFVSDLLRVPKMKKFQSI